MQSENKVCHQCGEQIKQIAKKCPFCQSWQKGFAAKIANPAVAPALAIIPLLLVFFLFSSLFRDKGDAFDGYRSLISVQDSKIHYTKEDVLESILLRAR